MGRWMRQVRRKRLKSIASGQVTYEFGPFQSDNEEADVEQTREATPMNNASTNTDRTNSCVKIVVSGLRVATRNSENGQKIEDNASGDTVRRCVEQDMPLPLQRETG